MCLNDGGVAPIDGGAVEARAVQVNFLGSIHGLNSEHIVVTVVVQAAKLLLLVEVGDGEENLVGLQARSPSQAPPPDKRAQALAAYSPLGLALIVMLEGRWCP